MPGKYKNKYRNESLRLQNWDYGWNAAYFVTMCTKNRSFYFGDILIEAQNLGSQHMQLSEIGKIAHSRWQEISDHFPYIKLGSYIVMPDHVHGIIIIDKPCGGPINRAPTRASTGKIPGGITGNKNPMLHDNLSRVIRWYKGPVTFESRQLDPGFAWQPLFYDHIIRNKRSYQNISRYIINNPRNWKGYKLYRR